MKSGLAETNIFKSNSQLLHDAEVSSIRPIWDRVLVRDIPDPDRIGSIWIPETAAERGLGKNGLIRMGEVVAVGPGDKWAKEWLVRDNTTGTQQVMRKALGVCKGCFGDGYCVICPLHKRPIQRCRECDNHGVKPVTCPECGGDGIRRWPMYCKVGDIVAVDRRKESEFYVGGERMYLVHEEQAILAILEGECEKS